MTAIRGAAAAVTGAAGGIGRALAMELAARGADLALADRDEAGLATVAAEIGNCAEGDDAPRRCLERRRHHRPSREAATAAHPGLNIVINNAGVALLGNFTEVDEAQMEWLMNINFWGVVRATRAFLPHLSRQREAHMVNLSSIFGIIAPPGQTAYCAAKFAVRGFSESLRHELAGGRTARCGSASCIPAASPPTSRAIPATAAPVTDNARRAEAIERFDKVATKSAGDGRDPHHRGHREERARAS